MFCWLIDQDSISKSYLERGSLIYLLLTGMLIYLYKKQRLVSADGVSLLDSLLVLADLYEDVYSDRHDADASLAEASRLIPLVIRGLITRLGIHVRVCVHAI